MRHKAFFPLIVQTILGCSSPITSGISHEQNATGHAFTSDVATLTYYEAGPRKPVPLILVAGGPGFDQSYLHIGDAFSKISRDHYLISYDQRGTGQASPVTSSDTVTVAQYIADIDALRQQLKVQQVALLGHSFGGYLAMGYATEHPDRVSQLILVDAVAPKRSDTRFIFNEAFPERMEAYGAWGKAINEGDSVNAVSKVDTYLSMLFYDPDKGEAWRKQATAVRFNPHPARMLWSDVSAPDLTDALASLKIPTLVITGRYDMNVSPKTAWLIHQKIPGSEYKVFERSGHLPFYEEPDAFASAITSFLEKNQ